MSALWQTVVRWAECDAAGIIYHARVFDWFSEARVQWLREQQVDYYRSLRPFGVELLLLEVQAEFLHAITLGQQIEVHVVAERIHPVRMEFSYTVTENGKLEVLVQGRTRHAFVIGGKAKRLDRQFPEFYQKLVQATNGINR